MTGARRRRLLMAAAVCLFALRTLIPIGFMVSVGAAGAAVTLCSDYAPLPSGAAAQHVHHHAHGATGAATNDLQLSGDQAHGLCPFAAAGHLGWHCPEIASISELPAQAPSRVAPATADVAPARLFLSFAHSPRAPPLLNLG